MDGGERFQRLADNALPLALLVQASLLFYRLDLLPIWGDEQFTLDVIRRPWAEIPAILQADIHPPIYYFLAKLWLWMPWPGELITQVRALSAVCCLLSTILVHRLWLRDTPPATRYLSVVTQATRAEGDRETGEGVACVYNDMKAAALFGRAIALMGFVSQLVRRGALSSPRELGKGYGSYSKFDRPHQQLPCQILPREASAAKRLRSYWFLTLWALSPTLLMYSRMARSYSLQLLIGTAAVFVAVRFLRTPEDRRLVAAYVVAASALLYTHYLPGLAVTGATGLLLVFSIYKNRNRQVIRALLFSSLGIVLLYGPWVSTLVSAVERVPGADPYVLSDSPWLETLVKLAYLLTSLSFGEAFPVWSIVVGGLVAPGLGWLLWKGARNDPAWLLYSLAVAFIAYLGAAAWVSFPFVGARLLFLLPLYLLWVLAGRAKQPRIGSLVCGGMILVSLGSLSSYFGKSNFLNQGYLVPFDEIATLIERESSEREAILLVDGYNTDPAPLLAAMRGKLPIVRIRDASSRSVAHAAIASGEWPKIWVLRNSHDISPGKALTALEAAASEQYRPERRLFVPFSPMDRLVARWLGRNASSHHYQMTKFTRRDRTR